eukprot:jgi/Bigna1/136280/aug1.33_g10988
MAEHSPNSVWTEGSLLELYSASERKMNKEDFEGVSPTDRYWRSVHALYNNPSFKPEHYAPNDPLLQNANGVLLFDPAKWTGHQTVAKLQRYRNEMRATRTRILHNYEKSGNNDPDFFDYCWKKGKAPQSYVLHMKETPDEDPGSDMEADWERRRSYVQYYLNIGMRKTNGDIASALFDSSMPSNISDVVVELGDCNRSDGDSVVSSVTKSSKSSRKRLRNMTTEDLESVLSRSFRPNIVDKIEHNKLVCSNIRTKTLMENRFFELQERLDKGLVKSDMKEYFENELAAMRRKLHEMANVCHNDAA